MTEIEIPITTTEAQIKTRTMKVTGTLLRQLLDNAGYSIPDDAEITVPVPGGGDWSNCDLDLDEDQVIKVTWTEEV